ncbi:hypothetical protein HK405_014311 [Cladochytrium tenue]|nr:hypothetical protein HK405_014311 [Cladochytrium tenue]
MPKVPFMIVNERHLEVLPDRTQKHYAKEIRQMIKELEFAESRADRRVCADASMKLVDLFLETDDYEKTVMYSHKADYKQKVIQYKFYFGLAFFSRGSAAENDGGECESDFEQARNHFEDIIKSQVLRFHEFRRYDDALAAARAFKDSAHTLGLHKDQDRAAERIRAINDDLDALDRVKSVTKILGAAQRNKNIASEFKALFDRASLYMWPAAEIL